MIGRSGAGRCVPLDVDQLAEAALAVLGWDASERQTRIMAGRRLVAAERNYDQIATGLAAAYAPWRDQA